MSAMTYDLYRKKEKAAKSEGINQVETFSDVLHASQET